MRGAKTCVEEVRSIIHDTLSTVIAVNWIASTRSLTSVYINGLTTNYSMFDEANKINFYNTQLQENRCFIMMLNTFSIHAVIKIREIMN